GLLEMYGQHPVAGRALRPTDKVADNLPDMLKRGLAAPVNVVLNETAVRKLGFASPGAAIGKVVALEVVPFPMVIVGVVRDFSLSGPEKKIEATAYDFF